jgi:peptide/nickel transport system substrate-binding protein
MARSRVALALMAAALVVGLAIADPTVAQKSGGVLRTYNSTNPPSASIVEEVTVATAMAFSGIFNNLLIFDQSKPRNGLDTIMPELAESWSWDETRTRLTVKLRQGVRWHDGKPFTAKDVQCTWYTTLGRRPDELRSNPRGAWWSNLKDVTLSGDFEATFVLGRAQASFPALLASNLSPVYPCHVSAKEMRRRPIGTGPFKLASFDSNQSIKLVKNTDYWKPGLPYLDGIEMSIIGNRSTRVLAFVAKEFDLTFVADITVPLIADVEARAPEAICELAPTGVSTTLLVNNNRPPFDNVKLRQAMALALDRQGMIDILTLGKAKLSGVMMAPPEGQWGMPMEMVMALPHYGSDQAALRTEARKIMESSGYGPNKRLKIKVSTRDFQNYKDPAVLLVDKLNQIWFDAELEIVESAVWFGRLARDDYAVALNLLGSGIDDPDVTLMESFACNSDRNYMKYCNPRVEKLLEEQSIEADVAKRKQIVWQIEKILAEDVVRPIIFHNRVATCWHPHVKGLVLHQNSIYNNWRLESVWLDR